MPVLWGTQIKTKEKERERDSWLKYISSFLVCMFKMWFCIFGFCPALLPREVRRPEVSPCLESQDCHLVPIFDPHVLCCLVSLFFPFSSFHTSPFSCLLSRMLKTKMKQNLFEERAIFVCLRFLKWQVGGMRSKLPYGTGVGCHAIALKNNPWHLELLFLM